MMQFRVQKKTNENEVGYKLCWYFNPFLYCISWQEVDILIKFALLLPEQCLRQTFVLCVVFVFFNGAGGGALDPEL